jgi:hypothetical protein
MPLHPEMVDWMVDTANEYVSAAVDEILKDNAAEVDATKGSIMAALIKVGALVNRPEAVSRYTAPNSFAVATASIAAAVEFFCQLLADSVETVEVDLAAWAGYMSEPDGDGCGFFAACDYAALPAESLTEFTYFLFAVQHYRDIWIKREHATPAPAAVEATQARWEKMAQDAEAALKRYEEALKSNPNTRPALRFVADNMPLLRNLAHMWPESRPLPWWLNSDQLKSELSEHPAQ